MAYPQLQDILNEISDKLIQIKTILGGDNKIPNDTLDLFAVVDDRLYKKKINKNQMDLLKTYTNRDNFILQLDIIMKGMIYKDDKMNNIPVEVLDYMIINKNAVKPDFNYKNKIELKNGKNGKTEIILKNINELDMNTDIIYIITEFSPIKSHSCIDNYFQIYDNYQYKIIKENFNKKLIDSMNIYYTKRSTIKKNILKESIYYKDYVKNVKESNLFKQNLPHNTKKLNLYIDNVMDQLKRAKITSVSILSFLDKYNMIQVRGDGNCYYRSMFYSLLIEILCSSNSTEIKIASLIELRNIFGENIKKFFNKLIEKLQKTGQINYFYLLKEYNIIDKEFVQIARLLTITTFTNSIKPETISKGGLNYSTILNSTGTNYKKYVNEQSKDGKCAESLVVELNIFANILKSKKTFLYFLNVNNDKEELSPVNNIESFEHNILPNNYIILKGGSHFDAFVRKI